MEPVETTKGKVATLDDPYAIEIWGGRRTLLRMIVAMGGAIALLLLIRFGLL